LKSGARGGIPRQTYQEKARSDSCCALFFVRGTVG